MTSFVWRWHVEKALAAFLLLAPCASAEPLRTVAGWKYELARDAIAGRPTPDFVASSGDLYGALNAQRFGEAKQFIAIRRQVLTGAAAVPYIGVLETRNRQLGEAVADTLRQLHFQADLIASESARAFPVLVLPAVEDLPEKQWPALESYVREGGILLASMRAGAAAGSVSESEGEAIWQHAHTLFGFHVTGRAIGMANAYLLLEPAVRHTAVDRGCLVKGPLWEVLAPQDERLGRILLPWQNLSYGFAYLQAPPDRESLYPGIVRSRLGRGSAVFLTLPFFEALQTTGFQCILDSLADLVRHVAPAPPFRLQAPPNVEARLVAREKTLFLNLLRYSPNRPMTASMEIEQSLPLHNVAIEVRAETRPAALRLLPEGLALDFTWNDGYVRTVLPSLSDWQILALSPR